MNRPSPGSITKWVGGAGAGPETGEAPGVTVKVEFVSWAWLSEGITQRRKRTGLLKRNNFRKKESRFLKKFSFKIFIRFLDWGKSHI